MCEIELGRLSRLGGQQDQYTIAIGGMLHLQHMQGAVTSVVPINLSQSVQVRLADHFRLFSPGHRRGRNADDILGDRAYNTPFFWEDCEKSVIAFLDALQARNYGGCMAAVRDHHEAKRIEFRSYMDGSLQSQLQASGFPFKLCGAGGTGHLLVGSLPEVRRDMLEVIVPTWGPELPWKPVHYGTGVIHAE